MTKKICAITILAMLVVIVAGLLLWQGGASSLTIWQKAEIEAAYKARIYSLFDESETSEALKLYEMEPFVWFDENGGKRDYGVYRYFGTYGDCIVLLRYGKNWFTADILGYEPPEEPPYRIPGLYPKVLSPVAFSIELYNTNPNYPTVSYAPYRSPLGELGNSTAEWLTDEQREQLREDLVNWLAEGNY